MGFGDRKRHIGIAKELIQLFFYGPRAGLNRLTTCGLRGS
jgi:hypothetical protein